MVAGMMSVWQKPLITAGKCDFAPVNFGSPRFPFFPTNPTSQQIGKFVFFKAHRKFC
eukprot:TRINITY_DN6543_c0_g1_i1.p2 TRINITY_DN6543_c0_g1~~TRINITY_DN6543_c0_g1_i1.p2  ORF type:complete len:57 (+),score=6.99 TRINITY_DN6543_c0_g1_i1:546-716(+)